MTDAGTKEAFLRGTRSRGAMDEDDRELLRRLFVAATELSETAQEAAIAGQSSAFAARDYADAAHRLLWRSPEALPPWPRRLRSSPSRPARASEPAVNRPPERTGLRLQGKHGLVMT